MTPKVILISHPNRQWPGARDLRTGQDGFLLAVSRNPLRDAGRRLLEEGLADPSTTLTIRDAAGIEPDVSSTIAEAAKGKPA
jgi:hypothetical protein